MAKRANPTVIGAFVVGAVGLIVIGILAFGSGRLFRQANTVVMYFSGSMSGLRVGAGVDYRGVRIGSVTDVRIVLSPDLSALIPVYAEIEPDRIEWGDRGMRGRVGRELIEKGLRAQLKSESLVTGQLYIDLDFHPDTPVRLVGADKRHAEIPTIPSTIEQISQTVKNLRLEELVASTMNTIRGVDRLVNGPEIQASVANLNGAIDAFRSTAQTVNASVQPVAASAVEIMQSLQRTAGNLESDVRGALAEYTALGRSANEELRPLVADLREALTAARTTFAETNKALAGAEALIRAGGTADTALQAYRTLAQSLDAQVPQLGQEARETAAAARAALGQAERTAASLEARVASLVGGLDATLLEYRKLAQDLDREAAALATEGRGTVGAATGAFAQAEKTLANADGLVSRTGATLDQVSQDISRLARRLDEEMGPLVRDLQATLAASRTTFAQADKALASADALIAPGGTAETTLQAYRTLAQDLDAQVPQLGQEARETSAAVRAALARAETTLASVETQFAGVSGSLDATLVEYRKLAQDLDREALALGADGRGTLTAATAAFVQAGKTLANADGLVSSSGTALDAASQDIRRLAQRLDQELGPLAGQGRETLETARAAITRLEQLVVRTEPHIVSSAAALEAALTDFRHLARTLDGQTGPFVTDARETAVIARAALVEAEKTLASARAQLATAGPALATTLDEYRKLAQSADRQLGALAGDGRDAVRAARAAFQQGEKALAAAERLIAPSSPLQFELAKAMRDFSSAARSFQAFAEDLERNPESLIRGKTSNRK